MKPPPRLPGQPERRLRARLHELKRIGPQTPEEREAAERFIDEVAKEVEDYRTAGKDPRSPKRR